MMTESASDYYLERLGSHDDDAGAASIPLTVGSNTIGRLQSNNIVLNSKYASRKHCTIYVTETNEVTVKNDAATNGIFVNGTQKLDRDTGVCLQVDDSLGIGCDTSSVEISDAECFIFKIRKNKSDEVDEVILLDESDDEEECKIMEEYSQMNLSEMKQEYMELEDFVEEYGRHTSIRNEANEEKPEEIVDLVDECDEEIQDEKTKEPKRESKKSERRSEGRTRRDSSKDRKRRETRDRSRRESRTESKTKDDKRKSSRSRTHSSSGSSSDRRHEKRKSRESDSTKTTKATTSRDSPLPQIIERHVTIPLSRVETSTSESDDLLTVANASPIESPDATLSKIINRRNSSLLEPISPPQEELLNDCNKPVEATPSRILKRRNTFVPSSTLSCGSTKRPIEIIAAPHLTKRRKSISAMPDATTPTNTKNTAAKWLSKKVSQKPRTKEEIKLKLAALVPDPKDKPVEAKTTRTHTKIPVKNTHKSRNDQLTDTIVKCIQPATLRKHKTNDVPSPTEPVKRPRMTETETEIAKDKPKKIILRRPSIVHSDTKTCPEKSVPSPDLSSSTTVTAAERSNSSTITFNGNNSSVISTRRFSSVGLDGSSVTDTSATATSPTVKSILKKTNSIQKRRATVTFSDDLRVRTVPNCLTVKPPVRRDEESIDDVIHNIMLQGTTALKQGLSSSNINGKDFPYKTVAHDYQSLRNLQQVFVPLMKAELWKEVEDGYAQLLRNKAYTTIVQINYCVPDDNYPNQFKYHCETQSAGEIQNGALVMLSDVNSGKDFLGYIINRQMANKICFFQFVTSCSAYNGSTNAPLKLRQLMYIRPNLKVFDALFKLKSSPLLSHILHPKQSCSMAPKIPFKYCGYNTLNQDQMITLSTVYRKCVSGLPFIALIEGPPGTGKSRVITNLVLQLLYGKELAKPLKILVCAPSNAAVDILTKNLMLARKQHLLEKGQKKMKLVRFGVLDKINTSVRGVSLQELMKCNEKTVLVEQNKLRECKKKKEGELAVWTANRNRDKITAIRNEIMTIETKIRNVLYDEKCLLEGANVICTTLNSCCTLSSKITSVDVCIIDEATQCNEPASLIPLQFGVKSLVLVGDTKQLPSTVMSEIAKQYNYDQSLFQRIQKSFESIESTKESPVLQLTTQYRMHPDILHWPNQYFYQNRLVSAEKASVTSFELKPYTVFNLDYVQTSHSEQKHISNVDEAKFVRNLLDFLVTKADPKTYSYGIISAYSQQKNDLAKVLSSSYPYVTVNTIDSCQGQERDIVIISIARTRGIGFLAIRQRLNVALTRAKKMLILCGNFNSLQSHPMWTSLLDDAKNRKLYIHLPTMDDGMLSSFFEKTLAT